jgi:hypothetical protein
MQTNQAVNFLRKIQETRGERNRNSVTKGNIPSAMKTKMPTFLRCTTVTGDAKNPEDNPAWSVDSCSRGILVPQKSDTFSCPKKPGRPHIRAPTAPEIGRSPGPAGEKPEARSADQRSPISGSYDEYLLSSGIQRRAVR